MSEMRWRYVDELRATGVLLARVAHDLNNPIAGILGYAHLASHETDPEKVKRYLGLVSVQAERCRDLIASVQDCANVPNPRKTEVAATAIVSGAIALSTRRFGELEIAVTQSAPDADLRVRADLQLLLRALEKLIDNACIALDGAQSPREITFHTWREADTVYIEIADNGPGIPEEVRTLAFDPTFTTRRSGKGLGLGLVTALSIMRAHGGDAWVAEPRYGGASIRLSLAAAHPLGPGEEKAEPSTLCLCVDDDEFVVEVCQEMFHALGARCLISPDIAGALELVRQHDFDFVITDYHLPGGSARDLYRQMVELRPELRGRVVVCTGDPLHPGVIEAQAEGELGLLPKPFAVSDLEALLARYGRS